MNRRDAESDGRSTGEPGRPVLLFQQLRAGGEVPPDFMSSGPMAYAVGRCSGDFQPSVPPDQPAVSAVPCANALEKGARMPRGTRQRKPSREVLALLSAKKSPGQKHSSVLAAWLYAHLVTRGGSVGLVWGHGELQRTGVGKEVLFEHQDLC